MSYISKAINDTFPPPPDPKAFDDTTWSRNITAAMSMKSWAPQWGPAPGQKGCLVPRDMVTAELIASVRPRGRAAA